MRQKRALALLLILIGLALTGTLDAVTAAGILDDSDPFQTSPEKARITKDRQILIELPGVD